MIIGYLGEFLIISMVVYYILYHPMNAAVSSAVMTVVSIVGTLLLIGIGYVIPPTLSLYFYVAAGGLMVGTAVTIYRR